MPSGIFHYSLLLPPYILTLHARLSRPCSTRLLIARPFPARVRAHASTRTFHAQIHAPASRAHSTRTFHAYAPRTRTLHAHIPRVCSTHTHTARARFTRMLHERTLRANSRARFTRTLHAHACASSLTHQDGGSQQEPDEEDVPQLRPLDAPEVTCERQRVQAPRGGTAVGVGAAAFLREDFTSKAQRFGDVTFS